jgi:hypothetical protein
VVGRYLALDVQSDTAVRVLVAAEVPEHLDAVRVGERRAADVAGQHEARELQSRTVVEEEAEDE